MEGRGTKGRFWEMKEGRRGGKMERNTCNWSGLRQLWWGSGPQ